MRAIFLLLIVNLCLTIQSQNQNINVLTLEEYLGYVKQFHPVVKQANLIIEEGQAKLMKARGAFDPKLEIDYSKKEFKNSKYYDKMNAAFKIPTWYGIELKASFEENKGFYLNPEDTTPIDGLYNVGVSIPLAKNLLTNKRMANLKQAKFFKEQSKLEQQLSINTILAQASRAYFYWLKSYKNQQVYNSFLSNAQLRFDGIKKRYERGDSPAIDTLEAGIILKSRKLELEKAHIVLIKSKLELSNYLWMENNIPIELQESMIPDILTNTNIDTTLKTSTLDIESISIINHPKLKVLDLKYNAQKVERRLQRNSLLPQINLEYNFLSQNPEWFNSINTSNYKTGLNIRFPIFLRKERGNLKLADVKLDAINFQIFNTKTKITNKFNTLKNELVSYKKQLDLTNTIVNDYATLLGAEERKFQLGDSSIFLVNSRESKLIEAQLKAIETENQYFEKKASIFELINATY
jgi:outer membrane protein TolC